MLKNVGEIEIDVLLENDKCQLVYNYNLDVLGVFMFYCIYMVDTSFSISLIV